MEVSFSEPAFLDLISRTASGDDDGLVFSSFLVGTPERAVLSCPRGTHLISSASLELKEIEASFHQVQALLPSGLAVIGLHVGCTTTDATDITAYITKFLEKNRKTLSDTVKPIEEFIVSTTVSSRVNTPKQIDCFLVTLKSSSVATRVIVRTNADEVFAKNFQFVRASISIPLLVYSNKGGYAEAVEKNKERILEQISSSQLLLASSKQFLSSDSKVQFDSLKPDAQIGGKSSVSVFSLRVMTCVTTSEAAHMPALQLTSKVQENSSHSLGADVLLCVSKAVEAEKLVVLVKEALKSQLQRKIFPLVSQENQTNPQAFHFQPPPLGHPITIVYALNQNTKMHDDYLVSVRRSLHSLLGLRDDRPLLRIPNALFGSADSQNSEQAISNAESEKRAQDHLLNVHSMINLLTSGSGGEKAKQFLVEGSYRYYHYLQDNFDDKGWGCAYRSLQTKICSWLVLQNYSGGRSSIPTHYEMQKALVEMGDKPAAFLNSTQWIGAVEISYCLDRLYGVSCKILRINSGEEVVDKATEIARHFATQGSPVMIGGGVLAYTMLGIEFNPESVSKESIRFLILDPHYPSASSNPKTIKEKGWCGWKTVDQVFKKGTFYNLCMPVRPRMI